MRELRNAISRMLLRASAGVEPGSPIVVDLPHLALERTPSAVAPDDTTEPEQPGIAIEAKLDLRAATEEFQRDRIRTAVQAKDDNWAAAARDLGLDRGNLHRMARRLGLLEQKS